jgi:hypothetical protein
MSDVVFLPFSTKFTSICGAQEGVFIGELLRKTEKICLMNPNREER